MKKLTILVSAMLISVLSISSFAYLSSTNLLSSNLNKNSSPLKTLGSAWKTYSSVQLKPNSHDITIVYGGADISRRPTLASHATTT